MLKVQEEAKRNFYCWKGLKAFRNLKKYLFLSKSKEYYNYFRFFIKHNYRPIARILMFIFWGLRTIKLRIKVTGVLTFLLIAGFLAFAYFNENYRWFFITISMGLLLLFLGVLLGDYAQYLFNGIRDRKRNDLQNLFGTAINTLQTQFLNRYEDKIQQIRQELNQVVKESLQQTGKELKVIKTMEKNRWPRLDKRSK